MVMPALDLTGRKFGYLTVMWRHGSTSGKTKCATWMCQCQCGTRVVRVSQSLRTPHRPTAMPSCGCKHGETVRVGKGSHGMTGERPWVIWQDLKRRCRNPSDKDYRNYGARGIDMPDSWFKSFEAFWEDVRAGYSDDLTLDRRNNDKGYSKSNCRWVTNKVQLRNTRVNVIIDTPWGRMTLAEAAERAGLSYTCMYQRHRKGYSAKDLFSKAGDSELWTKKMVEGRWPSTT